MRNEKFEIKSQFYIILKTYPLSSSIIALVTDKTAGLKYENHTTEINSIHFFFNTSIFENSCCFISEILTYFWEYLKVAHGCSNHLKLEMEAKCLKKNLPYLNLNISRTKNGRNKL